MKVLIACEFSGIVRDAFVARGHDAWSCDLLYTEKPGNHIVGDVSEIMFWPEWDLVIGHPPCDFLTISANRWYKDQPERKSGALVGEARREARREAIKFFMLFTQLKCRWAIENPIGVMSTEYRKPDQVLQPWMFGHGETKATCLWLNGVPKLKPTSVVEGREQRLHKLSPSKDRWKERSRTFPGIAEAMADQWGDILKTKAA